VPLLAPGSRLGSLSPHCQAPTRILTYLTTGVVVLDIVYILATIAVFAVVALVASGVEKL
jgi:hypothetical protein